ncbi:MAG: HAMP domain-containing protein [Patescibacteria group bacterium]
MSVSTISEGTGLTIRLRLLVGFFVIFLTIAGYGLYISTSTQAIHRDLVVTQERNVQYTLLWNLKYFSRHMTGKTRGVVFSVNNKPQLRREYDIALAQYQMILDQLRASLTDQVDLSHLEELERTSRKLRDDEQQLFRLTAQGETEAATRLIREAYTLQESQYVDLADQFLQQRGDEISSSVFLLRQRSSYLDMISFVILALILLMILFIFAMIHRNVIQPIQLLSDIAARFAGGEFAARAPTGIQDEIGVLSTTFNVMGDRLGERTRQLELAKQNLEADVKRRTQELEAKVKELERFNRFAVGRELKMIELKKHIKTCKKA